jgi:hypothetical protein
VTDAVRVPQHTCLVCTPWRLTERRGGDLSADEYHAVAESGSTHAPGNWVFTGVLNGPEFGNLAIESTVDVRSGQLIDAGPAVRLGDRHHLLPARLNRWPTPHPDRR